MEQDHGEQVPGPEERAVSAKREEGHHPMEVTFPLNGTHAAATPLIFPVVLVVVDFRWVAEGVAPSGEAEAVVVVKIFQISCCLLK
jgi:hypothetical protein